MRARDILLPVITSVAIFNMSLWTSCASQERVDQDGEVSETTVGENGDLPPDEAPPADENLGELGDAPPSDGLAENPPADAPLEPLEGSDQPPADENLGELPPEGELPATAEGDLPPPAEGDLPPATEGDLAVSDLPPADDAALGELPATDESLPPLDAAPSARGAYGFNAKAPQIPASAFQKAGANLNRFYFLRQGDTAQSAASQIYGSSSRSKDLKKWNKGAFAAGKVIYYQSASQPTDSQMRSYFQEAGQTPDEYIVKKGDSLSLIAKKKLGSTASWKEIAVLNGIERPDAIEKNQRLAIYRPGGSGTEGSFPSKVARNERQAPNQASQTAEGFAPPGNEPPPVDVPSAPLAEDSPSVQANIPPPVIDTPATSQESGASKLKKKKKNGFGLDIARLLEQNLFFIVIGAGVSVLLLALLAVNKRKKARAEGDGFNEDGFASARSRRR